MYKQRIVAIENETMDMLRNVDVILERLSTTDIDTSHFLDLWSAAWPLADDKPLNVFSNVESWPREAVKDYERLIPREPGTFGTPSWDWVNNRRSESGKRCWVLLMIGRV